MKREAIAAIVGLGLSELGRDPIGVPRTLAGDAVRAAIVDAGLPSSMIDGLLLNSSALADRNVLPLRLQDDLGLGELRLLSTVDGKGASVLQMVQMATLAIRQGMATAVACVFADAPLGATKSAGEAFGAASSLTPIAGWDSQYGLFGPVGGYAMLGMRYLDAYAIEPRHFGAHVLACRKWAVRNPQAFLRTPLTLDDYLAARMIAEPFRVLDCAYPVNGAGAVVVAGIETAAAAAGPGVYVHGMGQGHARTALLRSHEPTGTSAARSAGAAAFEMAHASAAEVTQCQFYDAFSYCAIAALEDYGICAPGTALGFVADGHTAPGGRLPVNTGGGQIAGFYLQGMTPLAEAVIQGRNLGGERQARNDLILVNGSGGLLEHHATLLLSPHRVLD
jgi:acetyl-CoA acetyltransferase